MENLSGEHIEAVREQLAKMRGCLPFKRRSRGEALLCYCVEQTLAGHTPTEYSIGVDVFERARFRGGEGETIVRTSMGEVRNGIADYYREDGAGDLWRIDIPKGRYVATFERRAQPTLERPGPAPLKAREANTQSKGQFVLIIIVDHPDDIATLIDIDADAKKKFMNASGNVSTKTKYLRKNSLFFYFESTQKEYEDIVLAFNGGTLTEIATFPIIAILPANVFEAQLQDDRGKALENCLTPIIELPPGIDELTVTVMGDIPGVISNVQLSVEAVVRSSSTMAKWPAESTFVMDVSKRTPVISRKVRLDNGHDELSTHFLQATFRFVRTPDTHDMRFSIDLDQSDIAEGRIGVRVQYIDTLTRPKDDLTQTRDREERSTKHDERPRQAFSERISDALAAVLKIINEVFGHGPRVGK